jgi:signal transduction histidine kinase
MLSAPKLVTYAYRLKGIDNEWLFTQQNSVQYTNLNDGVYTFEVKAKNEWGYWGKPATISFVITPPFWELWWFILITALVVIGTVYYVVRRQVQNVITLERLRLKIAADLHDNIGASLTEISIMSEILKSKITTDSDEVRKYLSSISSECRNVIASIRDIVWMVNPNQDSLKDLLTRLNDSFSDIFTQKGISFTAENIELLSNITLPMDYRHNLFLILKEGINNSLKYSYCDQLSLKAAINGKKLEVILKDNGIGIKPNYKRNGNGLTNMKNRAKKIGGDLFINSDIYKGTELKFMGKIS